MGGFESFWAFFLQKFAKVGRFFTVFGGKKKGVGAKCAVSFNGEMRHFLGSGDTLFETLFGEGTEA